MWANAGYVHISTLQPKPNPNNNNNNKSNNSKINKSKHFQR